MEDISVVQEVYKSMKRHNVVLTYSGGFNRIMLNTFLILIEKKLECSDIDKSTTKKIYHVMVECIQNIVKHSAPSEMGSSNMLIISEKQDTFHIVTGNYIRKEDIPDLTQRIDYINSLSKEKLREYYLERLTNGKISSKGGAGLGFIDMVRKTGNKLSYDFKVINGDKIFFILENTVKC